MKCGKRFLLGALLLFFSQSASSQSFVDSKIYQVEGSKLNALEKNLQTAKLELESQKGDLERLSNLLADSQRQSERLQIWLTQSQEKEKELNARLATVNRSYQELQNNARDEGESILLGAVLGVIGYMGVQWVLNGGK